MREKITTPAWEDCWFCHWRAIKKIIKVVRRTIMQNLDLRGDYNLRLGAKGVAVLLMQKFVMAHAIICGGCKVSPPMPGLQFRIERNEAAKV
jgi:hypothetical protein